METLSGSVRRTGKEDGREYELKPTIVVQRVQLPPGKGQSASRKPALRVTAMVALSVGEQVPKLRESASKSTNAEALVVRIAGAASSGRFDEDTPIRPGSRNAAKARDGSPGDLREPSRVHVMRSRTIGPADQEPWPGRDLRSPRSAKARHEPRG